MSELKFDAEKLTALLKKLKLFDVGYYLAHNEDVRAAEIDPVYHYVVAGEREGRRPCRLFDPRWYEETYRLKSAAVNLFLHYLFKGERAGYRPSPLFDPGYVRATYGLKATQSAFAYFLGKHLAEGIDPHAYFSTREYLELYPDVRNSTLPPYLHFVDYGTHEGRVPKADFNWAYVRNAYALQGDNLAVYTRFCEHAAALDWNTNGRVALDLLQEEICKNQQPGPHYEKQPLDVSHLRQAEVDVFAFYLPQFHQDADNDRWWGEGFTEWTNLSRGVPRYQGHYQPRVPGALGFYDLNNVEVLRKQAALARGAGISGFGIYYYDFGDKTVLRKPLRLLRENADIDLKYFLIWANETWSRRWDGSEQDILAAQTYPEGFEQRLAGDFADYFADPRYHAMDGRPFLVIYRPGHLPDSAGFIARLREACRAHGHDPLIYIAQSFGDLDPTVHGADGAMEFPPHKLSTGAHLVNAHKTLYCSSRHLRIFSYDELVANALNEPEPPYRLIKTAFPSWDNDARKQGNSNVVDGASPAKFENWLRCLIQRETDSGQAHPMVCINAWNEWGEGAYLEPDRHLGYANLNAVARSLAFDVEYRKRKAVLVGHDLFASGAQRLLLEIGRQLKHAGWDVNYLIGERSHCNEALLERYARVGPVRFLRDVEESGQWTAFHNEMRELRPQLLVFNTAVSAPWIERVPVPRGAAALLLVHEMSSILQHYCDASTLAQVVHRFTQVVFPAEVVREQFEGFVGSVLDNAVIQPQGLYKRPEDLLPWPGNAANFRTFLGPERNPLVVAAMGYADLRKGFDLFVETCVELDRRGLDVLFVWQGEIHADFRRWLLVQTEELVEQQKLLLVPPHENVANVLDMADAYFLSSREDPFPSVALEAWHFGVPVFAFKGTGGVASLIESHAGLGTVLPELSATQAADALEALLQRKLDGQSRDAQQTAVRQDFVRDTHDFAAFVRKLAAPAAQPGDVDVCVLAYNQQAYIEERLRSVLAQSALRASVTVFDAGSTDDTGAQVQAFNTEHGCGFKLVTTEPNGGYLPALWRAAVQQGSAEFVWLAEGDDSAYPGFLERCVQILRKDPDIGLVFTGLQRIDGQGRPIAMSLQAYVESLLGARWAHGGCFEGQEFLADGATVANPITNISGVVFRRQALLEALDVFDGVAGVTFAFDWILYAALAKNGWKVAYTPEILNCHRVHTNSFSGELDLKVHIKEIKQVYECLDTIAKFDAEQSRIKYIEGLEAQVG